MNRSFHKSQPLRNVDCNAVEVKSKVGFKVEEGGWEVVGLLALSWWRSGGGWGGQEFTWSSRPVAELEVAESKTVQPNAQLSPVIEL